MTRNKVKLTLSVDKEVVEAAKKLGLNLSDVTENILRGFSFSPRRTNKGELLEKYRNLFDAMKPLLHEFGVSVPVGVDYAFYTNEKEHSEPFDFEIRLLSNGVLFIDEFNKTVSDVSDLNVNALHSPKMILKDLILELSKGAENRKEKIREIEMARRIIEALSNSLIKDQFTDKPFKPKAIGEQD
ncbi:MAG: type II toxin-antitoxin system CcdA family antitoxin [Nitrososphaerota archaeon]|nr:type II toxin-antitoxin system CcdA family antitoxin [Nitrososphaerota archaeon]